MPVTSVISKTGSAAVSKGKPWTAEISLNCVGRIVFNDKTRELNIFLKIILDKFLNSDLKSKRMTSCFSQ